MILIIDNFDSFTYNLVQLLGELKQEVKVFRNDAITVEEAEKLHPDYLVVSPGPCTPDKAGVSIDMIRHFAGRIPVLGVCLGHQAVGAAFGGKIVKAKTLMHGKISDIMHDGKTLFSNLPPVITATRYHSLAVEASSLPDCLEVSAWTDDGEIMALRHREHAVEGLQFHPESVATATGREIIENFINRTKESTLTHLKQVLGKVTDGGDLSAEEMKHTMELVMEGKATPAQIGSFITALKMKGETPIEISSAAAVMREKATHITVPRGVTVVDTCGTGGDGAHTFNISTVAALIAAGAGVTVAKHGNRSVSSKCGSADVLVELGIDIGISPDRVSACLKEAGIAFLFAPSLHSAMRHVIGPRRELGVRTIFNILGPLANPAFADAQLLGVYDRKLVSLLAEVLKNLGTRRALVVHGSDGLDEITLTGKTWASELKGGKIEDYIIDPEDFGFSYCSPEELTGGAPDENAAIVLDILAGREKGPKRDIALLNAGAAVYIGGKGQDLGSAIGLARESVSSGAAMKKLEKLRQVTNG